ncbi:MAG: ABC transporter ATP-binding protein, partial [Nitrospirales bacterium]|nr:ABC transporter ATP-binding protein [Nitrospirales bacterium]
MTNGKKGGEVILELAGISLSFGGVKAITNISFAVRNGEICSIIGPNGAGKSSLLNVINGVYHPQEGEIVFKGQRHRQMKPRDAAIQGIARTFQNIALFKGMTVLDNIITGRTLKMKSTFLEQAFWLKRAREEERENRRKAEEIIEFLQIQAVRKTLVGKLPYGLQKRVELGRALAAEPTLLLLDEPMAGMSVEEKQDMVAFIMELHSEFGMTVVLIEHDIGVVMDISDHIVVLDYGRKIADGPPREIACNEEVIAAYLGTKA